MVSISECAVASNHPWLVVEASSADDRYCAYDSTLRHISDKGTFEWSSCAWVGLCGGLHCHGM